MQKQRPAGHLSSHARRAETASCRALVQQLSAHTVTCAASPGRAQQKRAWAPCSVHTMVASWSGKPVQHCTPHQRWVGRVRAASDSTSQRDTTPCASRERQFGHLFSHTLCSVILLSATSVSACSVSVKVGLALPVQLRKSLQVQSLSVRLRGVYPAAPQQNSVTLGVFPTKPSNVTLYIHNLP